uniref:Uncharacterized protein n=1 Tax=Arundo donax TaxID=35708 RepID=A0A0A9BM67_ARUDO
MEVSTVSAECCAVCPYLAVCHDSTYVVAVYEVLLSHGAVVISSIDLLKHKFVCDGKAIKGGVIYSLLGQML